MTMESLSREYLMKITHFEEYRPRQMELLPELKLISVLVFGIKYEHQDGDGLTLSSTSLQLGIILHQDAFGCK